MEKLILNNGVEMPNFGLGTYLISPEYANITVREGINMGYRLIDTANAYMNERAVGRGIAQSNQDRKDIFLSTKLWVTEYENENAIDETLERLGTDYIDLLFLHQPGGNYMAGYRMLEKAYKEGKIRAIGVSNFEGEYLEEILKNCEIKPQVIQVEAHPYFRQEELRKVIDKEDIKLMSWYPLGHGDSSLMKESVFQELGNKYHKTPAQIILRWHLDMGFIAIPGSKNIDHVRENFDIFDFKLSEEDMKKIESINKKERYYVRTKEALERFSKWQPEYEK